MKDYTITVLGCGVMGSAITSAILKSKFEPYPKKMFLCTAEPETLAKQFGDEPIVQLSSCVEDNRKAVKEADVIILGLKPFMYEEVYEQVKDSLTGDQLIISLMAGVTIKELSIFSKYVAKVMTNTPARYGCGTAAISFAPAVTKEQQDLVNKLIEPIGLTVTIPEKNMDIATSLIGSGPAFCLLMME